MAFIPQTGSTVAFQGNPSLLQATVGLNSTNASVITVGSPVANQSVSGTVAVSNFPVQSGSVVAFQGTTPFIITGSVQGNFGGGNSSVQVLNFPANQSVSGAVSVSNFPTTQNVSGSVIAFQGGAQTTSIMGGASVFQAGTWSTSVMTNVITSIATAGQVMGSVAALQATNPWNIAGSVAAVQIGTRITSIAGIVQASVHGAVSVAGGLLQASVHGAVTFQSASVVSGHGSVNGVASVQVLAAPGSGLYTYVTDFLVSNTGAATTLVTFTDGDGSVMGKTIAPAGGGSNAVSMATPMRTLQTNKVVNVVAATATSVLHAWVGGYRAP